MDSRASTCISTLPVSSPPNTSLALETDYASTMSKTFTLSSTSTGFTSSFTTFRPSPLNPKSPKSLPTSRPSESLTRKTSFPTSRPLRPFPSIVQSRTDSKPTCPRPSEPDKPSKLGEGSPASAVVATKRPQKPLEISPKWKGGFLVLGMTQAEFSRRD